MASYNPFFAPPVGDSVFAEFDNPATQPTEESSSTVSSSTSSATGLRKGNPDCSECDGAIARAHDRYIKMMRAKGETRRAEINLARERARAQDYHIKSERMIQQLNSRPTAEGVTKLVEEAVAKAKAEAEQHYTRALDDVRRSFAAVVEKKKKDLEKKTEECQHLQQQFDINRHRLDVVNDELKGARDANITLQNVVGQLSKEKTTEQDGRKTADASREELQKKNEVLEAENKTLKASLAGTVPLKDENTTLRTSNASKEKEITALKSEMAHRAEEYKKLTNKMEFMKASSKQLDFDLTAGGRGSTRTDFQWDPESNVCMDSPLRSGVVYGQLTPKGSNVGHGRSLSFSQDSAHTPQHGRQTSGPGDTENAEIENLRRSQSITPRRPSLNAASMQQSPLGPPPCMMQPCSAGLSRQRRMSTTNTSMSNFNCVSRPSQLQQQVPRLDSAGPTPTMNNFNGANYPSQSQQHTPTRNGQSMMHKRHPSFNGGSLEFTQNMTGGFAIPTQVFSQSPGRMGTASPRIDTSMQQNTHSLGIYSNLMHQIEASPAMMVDFKKAMGNLILQQASGRRAEDKAMSIDAHLLSQDLARQSQALSTYLQQGMSRNPQFYLAHYHQLLKKRRAAREKDQQNSIAAAQNRSNRDVSPSPRRSPRLAESSLAKTSNILTNAAGVPNPMSQPQAQIWNSPARALKGIIAMRQTPNADGIPQKAEPGMAWNSPANRTDMYQNAFPTFLPQQTDLFQVPDQQVFQNFDNDTNFAIGLPTMDTGNYNGMMQGPHYALDGSPYQQSASSRHQSASPRQRSASVVPFYARQQPKGIPDGGYSGVVCNNCHREWWNTWCDDENAGGCENCESSEISCVRPRCENFAGCIKTSCKKAHEKDGFAETVTMKTGAKRKGRKDDDHEEPPRKRRADSQSMGLGAP